MAFSKGKAVVVGPRGEYELTQETIQTGQYVRTPAILPFERPFYSRKEIHEPLTMAEKEAIVAELGQVFFLKDRAIHIVQPISGSGQQVFRTKKWKRLQSGPITAAARLGNQVYYTSNRDSMWVATVSGSELVGETQVFGFREYDEIITFPAIEDFPPHFYPGRWHRYRLSAASAGGKVVLFAEERFLAQMPTDWAQVFYEMWRSKVGAYYYKITIQPVFDTPFNSCVARYSSVDGFNFSEDWRAGEPWRYGVYAFPEIYYLQGSAKNYLFPGAATPLILPVGELLDLSGQVVQTRGYYMDPFSSFGFRTKNRAYFLESRQGAVLRTKDEGLTWEHVGYFTINDPETGLAVTSECEIFSVGS